MFVGSEVNVGVGVRVGVGVEVGVFVDVGVAVGVGVGVAKIDAVYDWTLPHVRDHEPFNLVGLILATIWL